MILADSSGGGNNARSPVWKHARQERLADRCRLIVMVCHAAISDAGKISPNRTFTRAWPHNTHVPISARQPGG